MHLRLVAVLTTSLATAAPAAPPPGSAPPSSSGKAAPGADPAPVHRSRVLLLEEVKGDTGTAASRTALREAITRHLGRRGFQVLDGGKRFAFRLQPKILLLDVQNGSSVEVKASVVALDGKGSVAAMVEGGARAKGGPPPTPAGAASALEAQAIEAAARSLVEDLAPRLVQHGPGERRVEAR